MIRNCSALAVLAVVLVSAGCTGTTSTTSTTPSGLPERPRSISVDRFDPCSALDDQHRSALGLGAPSLDPPRVDGTPGTTSCSWRESRTEKYVSYSVETSVKVGAEAALKMPEHSISIVSGFPAVVTRSPYLPEGSQCIVVVDVAANQALVAIYYINNSGTVSAEEQACQKARTAAEFAMQTLIRQAGG